MHAPTFALSSMIVIAGKETKLTGLELTPRIAIVRTTRKIGLNIKSCSIVIKSLLLP